MKVAIIGAGLSGLVSAKECLAEGIEIDVFEALPHIGGQWFYSEPDPETGEVMSSVYKGVMMNSCRDTSSFSDFPLDPKRYPPYLEHKLQLQYLQEYAQFYDLPRHVRLNTKVIRVEPLDDGSWKLLYESRESGPIEAGYDAVIACSGRFTFPNDPSFPGKESFKGVWLHSHFYRSPSPFEGKRVAIIGLGASAVDVSCELIPVCREVHIISRRGAWIVPRFVLGKPTEAWDGRLAAVLPSTIAESTQRVFLNLYQGKHPPELKPDHKITASIPLVRSDFMERVKTGKVHVHRVSVDRINENSISLSDGSDLEVDAVITCTGFKTKFPYLPVDIMNAPTNVDGESQDQQIYKLIKPIKYPNIFMIGLADAAGPAAPLYESQVRWSVGVLNSKIILPSQEQQLEAVRRFNHSQKGAVVASERHSVLVPYLEYIDDLLKPLGANPTISRMAKLFMTSGHPLMAARMASAVYGSLAASAQWRLFGHGAKTEWAMESMLRVTGGKAELTARERDLLEKMRPEVKV